MSYRNIHIHRGRKCNGDCQGIGEGGEGWSISIECCRVSVGEDDEDLEKVDDDNNMTVLRVIELGS